MMVIMLGRMGVTLTEKAGSHNCGGEGLGSFFNTILILRCFRLPRAAVDGIMNPPLLCPCYCGIWLRTDEHSMGPLDRPDGQASLHLRMWPSSGSPETDRRATRPV